MLKALRGNTGMMQVWNDARWCAPRPNTSTGAFIDTSDCAQIDCIGGKEWWISEEETPVLFTSIHKLKGRDKNSDLAMLRL